MRSKEKISILLLRLSMGWLFFYAGITKVINPEWTATGFLKGAQTFTDLYNWLASASNIGWVDFLNQWGLTLIGLALIFGLFTRLASVLGIILMLLYYFPTLNFPYAGDHSFIIDEHIIYSVALLILCKFRAGNYWGLDGKRR